MESAWWGIGLRTHPVPPMLSTAVKDEQAQKPKSCRRYTTDREGMRVLEVSQRLFFHSTGRDLTSLVFFCLTAIHEGTATSAKGRVYDCEATWFLEERFTYEEFVHSCRQPFNTPELPVAGMVQNRAVPAWATQAWRESAATMPPASQEDDSGTH